jgi:putative endonuclease
MACHPKPGTQRPAIRRPAVYVLLCKDGSLYTGATVDLGRRLEAHRCRRGARYTRGRLPVTLLCWWHPASFELAKSQEALFKRLRRDAKLAALGGTELFDCVIHRGEPRRGEGES